MRKEAVAAAGTHGTKRLRVETPVRFKCSPSKESQKARSDRHLMEKELAKHKLSFSDSDSDIDSDSSLDSSLEYDSDEADSSSSTHQDPSSSASPHRKEAAFNSKGRCYRSRDLENLATILLNYVEADDTGDLFRAYMSKVRKGRSIFYLRITCFK